MASRSSRKTRHFEVGPRLTYASFDEPRHSRLFLVLAKKVVVAKLRQRFAAFGCIEEFWMPRQKHTRQLASAVFVKYARSSQACRAVEETRGTLGDPDSDLAQVSLAQSRAAGKSGDLDLELLARIHIEVPKSFTEVNLRDTFKVYGDIVSCVIRRNQVAEASKDLACIRFSKASQAALAIEECDKSYHAVWADVRTDLPESPCCVNGSKQETTNHEVQGASVNSLFSRTPSTEPVTKISASGRHELGASGTEQKADTQRIQGCSLNALGLLGSKAPITKIKLSTINRDRSYVNRIEKKASRVQRSNLITLASATNTKNTEPSAKSSESSKNVVSHAEEKTNCKSVKKSKWTTSGFTTILPEPVPKQPECHEQSAGSTDSTLTGSVTEPPKTDVYCSYVNSAVQEPNIQRIQGDSLTTLDKSLKPSEHKFYVGFTGQKTRSHKVCGSSLLASVGPPDLASVKRSKNKRKESISRCLLVVSEFQLAQAQIFSLFDVIPGLESCETRPGLYSNRVYAMIQYRNVASAVYAKCRLHGLEYPPGNRLHVSFMEGGTHGTDFIQEMATQLVTSQLASVVWNNNWAPQLLKSSESQIPSPHLQTDAELPSRKRKAPPDSSVRERLFIIFDPYPLPQDVLDSVLSRFGNFINSHLIPGENVAYAMFAEREGASDAIAVLYGKTVNGVKLKVKLADLPTEDLNKRQLLF